MHLPATYWAYLALLLAIGTVCRAWPRLALYGATGAFCAVYQAVLRELPPIPPNVFADSLLFVLPSAVLAHACGVSEFRSTAIVVLVPVAIIPEFGEIRTLLLTLGVATAQGSAALVGLRDEIRSANGSASRRVAIVIASVGVFGLVFVRVWSDVAWTGVVSHAFACLAYFVHENGKQRLAVPLASQNGRSPFAKRDPRAEDIEDAECRPDRGDEDPR